ncbi:anaphase-promoting complex subunit 7 isoform X2 [Ctenocephalides felis]|uniref:anaphase-promoting complex subunit 7 isoform X2 n=1 Tax=Ctenocephalides felis TaxID=7515 RepID=UPI000E6E1443|nr:anaphase-promoting complex subunit 7 isoform X2 [Ctenocephalides felis]
MIGIQLFSKQVKLLYDQELYSNVVSLANLVLSTADGISEAEKFDCNMYYAESLFKIKQYRKAATIYKTVLSIKKNSSKNKLLNTHENKIDISEAELAYKLHLCYMELKQYQLALNILQQIPAKQRSLKIMFALGELLRTNGHERLAITCYKDLLKECPLSLQAIDALLSLGVKGNEISGIILEVTEEIEGSEWLRTWIKAQAFYHCQDYAQAISTLKSLDVYPGLRINSTVLTALAESYYYNGDYKNAYLTFQRAKYHDPQLDRGLSKMACLYLRSNKLTELEQLVSPMLPLFEYTSETWTAQAYCQYALKKNSRALYFAHKACLENPQNVDAMILKGTLLLESKKHDKAISHFRDALTVAPYQFEIHKGIVDTYLSWDRYREAVNAASNACKQIGSTPRPLTLYASVLMKDANNLGKAKTILEKVLKINETHTPAVLLMVDILEQQHRNYSVVQLLHRQLAIQPSAKLYQVLGDFLARPGITHDLDGALTAYTKALTLEPNNQKAQEGINKLDQRENDASYDHLLANNESGDSNRTPSADSSNIGNESATDAVWSDMELEINVPNS